MNSLTYRQIKEFLELKLPGVYQGTKLNQYASKPLKLEPTPENAEIFNEIYQFIKASDLNTLERSKSGSIRKGPKYFKNLYAWDLQRSSLGVMLTISIGGELKVIKFGLFKADRAPDLYPTVAFSIFTNKCLEHGIDLEDYAIKGRDAEEVKAKGKAIVDDTEAAPIEIKDRFINKTLKNVHHIDFHSSFPAGLVNTHPEFKPVMEYFYNKRKTDEAAKFIMNSGIGYMCTDKCGVNRRWAHLRKDAVEDNNRRITELELKLITTGHQIIGYNTDGIWYQGGIYHDENEGPRLGQWANDHTNCTFRAKSNGAYEFIENNEYHAVVRGQTTYDTVEPDRSKWTWGDIYKAVVIGWKFDKEKGVYFNEEI